MQSLFPYSMQIRFGNLHDTFPCPSVFATRQVTLLSSHLSLIASVPHSHSALSPCRCQAAVEAAFSGNLMLAELLRPLSQTHLYSEQLTLFAVCCGVPHDCSLGFSCSHLCSFLRVHHTYWSSRIRSLAPVHGSSCTNTTDFLLSPSDFPFSSHNQLIFCQRCLLQCLSSPLSFYHP